MHLYQAFFCTVLHFYFAYHSTSSCCSSTLRHICQSYATLYLVFIGLQFIAHWTIPFGLLILWKSHKNYKSSYFLFVEMIIKILLYNSEFFIKRKSFSVSLITSKRLDYIFTKHNVNTCML